MNKRLIIGELMKLDILFELAKVKKDDPGAKLVRMLVECGCPVEAVMEFAKRFSEEEEEPKAFKTFFVFGEDK